jgi:hypothetical protein
MSTDNSMEIIQSYNVNSYIYEDYRKKGDYICKLINDNPCDIAIPIDIDEFIGLHEGFDDIESIKVALQNMLNTGHERFAFKYYLTNRLTVASDIKYITNFDKIVHDKLNKKFFKGDALIALDHGNHMGVVKNYDTNKFITSNLILYHFHYRGINKLIEKCTNDILGLKIVSDIYNIIELENAISRNVVGSHNIKTLLTFITCGPEPLMSTTLGDITSTSLANFL